MESSLARAQRQTHPWAGLDPGARTEQLAWSYPRWAGPFAFQPNSSTRVFEYPWAFHAAEVKPGSRVVEIGGSLSGFQFVLARSGAQVINVDPGEAASGVGWPVDDESLGRLNRAFKTRVELINSTLQEARLENESADVVYSISTIEHIPPDELPSLMQEVQRILRPGGAAVLTVDLFLDLDPFASDVTNEFGTNVSVHELVQQSGLKLVAGNPKACSASQTLMSPTSALDSMSTWSAGIPSWRSASCFGSSCMTVGRRLEPPRLLIVETKAHWQFGHHPVAFAKLGDRTDASGVRRRCPHRSRLGSRG